MKERNNMDGFSMTKQKFINQWLRHFASTLPKKQLDRYVTGQYIWHVFSYHLTDKAFLEGNAAREAFDRVDKRNCICCDAFGESGVIDGLPLGCYSAKSIEKQFSEFYVVSADYSWTYIKTHEGDLCGPYFLKAE